MTACCAIPGCDRPVARVYPRTPEAFAPLCALCRDNAIPIVVFSIREPGNLARVLAGEGTATIITQDPD